MKPSTFAIIVVIGEGCFIARMDYESFGPFGRLTVVDCATCIGFVFGGVF